MADTVRIGVIGTGMIADRMHIPTLQGHPLAEVVAVCSRREERAREVAAKHSVPEVFTDYRKMIAEAALDAVVVATPDDTHHVMTLAALDAGLHVLCEKPMAMNAQQAEEMYRRAEGAGLKHMVYLTYRWFPLYRHLKRLVEQGALGRPYEGSFRYSSGYARGVRTGWRYQRDRHTGALGDLGSHMIDLARWLLGDITSVSASLSAYMAHEDQEGNLVESANDVASLILGFASGAQATLHVSAVAHEDERGQKQYVVLHGSDGTLETDLVGFSPSMKAEIRGLPVGEKQFQVLDTPADLLEGLDPGASVFEQVMQSPQRQPVGGRLFVDAILNETPLEPSFYDGWKAQQVVDAAFRSHAEGRRVSLPA